MSEILAGKVALVTGAGRGIGRAIAIEYAKEGAKVALVSRGRQNLDEAVDEIKSFGGVAMGFSCDVGIKTQVDAAVAQAAEAFGGLDILVNNAQSFGTEKEPAPFPVFTPIEKFRDEEWERTFLTGPTATYWFMKSAFPHLKVSGAGRIINFGSHWGQIGFELTVAYNSAKEAIRGLSRTAAREWGKHGITVNVINPAAKTAELVKFIESNPEVAKAAENRIPLRRYGELDDTARVAVFLAGPDSSYLTGMTFQVDGGMFIVP